MDGTDIRGCTQENAARLLDKSSEEVTVRVAKMAAAYYGIFSEEGEWCNIIIS